jgi:hypothetical protein
MKKRTVLPLLRKLATAETTKAWSPIMKQMHRDEVLVGALIKRSEKLCAALKRYEAGQQ